MEKITRELLKVSGIYCIENKINHKSYRKFKEFVSKIIKTFCIVET